MQRLVKDDVSDRHRRKAGANADLGRPVAADHAVWDLAPLAEVDRLAGLGRPEPADPNARQPKVLRRVRQGTLRRKALRELDGRPVDLRALDDVVVEDQAREDADPASLVQPCSNPHTGQASKGACHGTRT